MPYELIRDTGPCPTPNKAAYHTKSRALIAADGARQRLGELSPYLCACGRYHLTAQGGHNDHYKARGGRAK